MHKFALCIHLLQLLILYLTYFAAFLAIAISFYALLLHSGFVLSVLNIIHELDLESVCFIPNTYTVILYTVDMFCILLIVFICGFMECK